MTARLVLELVLRSNTRLGWAILGAPGSQEAGVADVV